MIVYTTIHKPGVDDPIIPGATPAICFGGAGWRGKRPVVDLYDWMSPQAIAARGNVTGSIYPMVNDAALATYVTDLKANPTPLLISNYAENRETGPNRLYHLGQQVKLLAAVRSTGTPTALFDFPNAFATNAENDYAWRMLKSKVDAVCIAIYFDKPDGSITPDEMAGIARRWSEGNRLAGTTKSVGIVISAFTHDGRAIVASKRAELMKIIVALDPDFLVVWGDRPEAKENAEMVKAAKVEMQD